MRFPVAAAFLLSYAGLCVDKVTGQTQPVYKDTGTHSFTGSTANLQNESANWLGGNFESGARVGMKGFDFDFGSGENKNLRDIEAAVWRKSANVKYHDQDGDDAYTWKVAALKLPPGTSSLQTVSSTSPHISGACTRW